MKLPIQAQSVMRNASTAKMKLGDGVNPSLLGGFDPLCLIQCAGALAQCISSSNPVQCLIQAGASNCIRCLG